MKGLLLSYGSDLYLYGGMPHTAFTSANRNLNTTSFAYPDGQTIFMRLNSSSGNWESVSCEGAVPESKTRIHAGHAGECVQRDLMSLTGKRAHQGHQQQTPALLPLTFHAFVHLPMSGLHMALKLSACATSHVRQGWRSFSPQTGRQYAARPLYCFAAVSTSA